MNPWIVIRWSILPSCDHPERIYVIRCASDAQRREEGRMTPFGEWMKAFAIPPAVMSS